MPAETKKLKGLCPVCGKKLLVGVLNRVEVLADRKRDFVPPRAIPYKSVIPLEEVIADTFGVGVQSKKVSTMYESMLTKQISKSAGKPVSEFDVLLDLDEQQIAQISTPQIAQAIIRVRNGNVHLEGGYDGVFGKVHIFDSQERDKSFKKSKQSSLF